MAGFTKINIAKALTVLLITLVMIKCANQLPPGGGEIDKIPPEVLEILPTNGTTNFSGEYFEITFSEYVDKRSVQDAIFISPAIEGSMEYDWSGTSVEVYFVDTLKENTTYSISIGTDVKDIKNGNRMAEAFNFAFSTGDKIDSYEIHGKVYDKDPSGIMIYAYKKDTTEYNPLEIKPDYISQVGNNGKYKLLGLSEGIYRVFAVYDDFMDFIYAVGEDRYGAPYKEVFLNKSDSLFSTLDFQMTKEDTSRPHLQNVTMTDINHFFLEFSEALDSTKLSTQNFYLYDSTADKRIDVRQVFKGKAKKNELFVTITDSLSDENLIYLAAENFYDKFGNMQLNEQLGITVNTKPDTIKPFIFIINTEFPKYQVDFDNPYIDITFDDGVDTALAKTGILIEDVKEIPVEKEINFIDNSSFRIKIIQKLKPKREFKLKIDMNKVIDAAGNKLDSVIVYQFKTVNDLDFTGVSGKLINIDEVNNPKIVLENIDPKLKIKYVTDPQQDGVYEFDRVVPGKYFVWSFEDVNENRQFDFGEIYPYQTSERFTFYSDTLNIRPRWPYGDVFIEYK
ncbi:MAG: Ig-like domain-containing protein [Melioribacteraceae bacterium]|nr:Ig-like domain-containing protein [Melioribacteraceae bacterium]MCF8354393.1 Ig-like domain-containing protein [Melioribacteraceae bacterium]MCF8393010.1 Ig-like domain-containing protein [Melioribacteraceae bacterium]MCF8417247.1 Ig-like domain-containing protein [Melioribacteraceae bacterium]